MDNENLELGFNAPGIELIERAFRAVDTLTASMNNFASAGPALRNITTQVEMMQASMTTGFKEVEVRIDKFQEKIKQASQGTTNYAQQRLAASQAALAAERAAAAESERIAQQLAAAEASRANLASGYAAKRLAASQGALAAERAAAAESERMSQSIAQAEVERTKNSTNYAQQRLAASQAALAAERATATQAAILAKATADAEASIHAQRIANGNAYSASRLGQTQARLAQQREEAAAEEAIAKRAALTEQTIQSERLAANRNYAQQRLAQSQANIAADRAAAAEQASVAERQRMLNTNFLSSSARSQVNTVKEAQIYGSLGGDVSARYGSNVAGLASNTAEYKKLEQAALSSAGAVSHHNEAMKEGHAFARGLSGALGTLWITYGSLAPLLAGAAIAGSLRKVYEAGKDVEYQLAFVKALSEKPVDLEKFLGVTEGTVVSVKAAAEGMRALAQNGLDANTALAALPAVLNLATIGELSVADAALSATGVLAAFNMEVSQIERVGDIFAKAAATSNTSVAGMTESMKTASTASALFSVSIEETAASIGILAKLNITGSAAGTSFRNILKDLYEPTKKQGDAMARLGITTRDSNDGLKGYVQILSEIREKTAGLSEGGRLNFLSQISDERGAKALIATLNNWDEFKKKIDEATNAAGFTQKAVLKLEDTVEGASKRMANSFQNTFIKAFTSAAPIIQATMTELGDLAKSEGFIKFFSSAAEGVANLTRFVIEHANAITNLVLVYAAFKGIGYVVASYNALAAAMGTSTVAATVETLVTRAATAAKAAFTATTATAFPIINMDTVAKVESTVATRALATANTYAAGTARLLTLALGPIALAIGAAVVAYELFIKRAEESDKELLKQSNTLNVINEDLDRQIEKLKTRNELWDPSTLQFKETQLGGVEDVIKRLKSGVAQAEATLAYANAGGTGLAPTGNVVIDAPRRILELKGYQDTLDQRKEMLATALKNEPAMRAKEADLNVQKSVDSFRAEQERLKKEYEAFINLGTAKSHTGALMASPAQQAVYGKAEGLIPNVFGAKSLGDIDNLRNSLKLLKDEANSVSEGFDKIDTKGLNEAYRSALNQASASAATYSKMVEGDLARARSSYDAGTIGSIQLINAEATAARNMAGAKAEAATISANLAAKEGKQDDYEKYLGQRQTAEAEFAQTYITEAQRLADAKVKIEAETAKTLVAELEARGEYVKAEDVKLEQGFTLALKRMNADLQSLGAGGQSGTPLFAALLAQADQAEQEMRARRQAAQQKEYEATAKGILDQAEIIKNGVAATLDTLNQRASEGAGIFDEAGIKAAADAIQNQAIPGYNALILKAKELAKESPELGAKTLATLEKNVAAADKQITKLQKSLTGGMFKELARNFDAMGESFKGIADAVYGVGVALENLALISEKEKRGDKVSMQERIGGYGDMAAAASKAFKEETGGYQALSGVAKAFHAAQLVMNLASTASGVIAGAAQMFAQSGWGGFAGVAAMAGVMGTLGYAIGGGFNSSAGGKSAADMQKEQGTGSVFGNASAKSESLTKSIEILEKNSNLMLPVNQGMLSALRNIEASMVGLTNLVVRTPGVTSGGGMGIKEGMLSGGNNVTNLVASIGEKVFGGSILGTISRTLSNLFSNVKQTIVDSGVQFGGNLSDLQAGKGINQYASVDTTSSSWFGLVKKTSNAIQTQGISSELSQQFGLIFTNLEDALKAASGSLGSTAENVEKALGSLSIATTSVSLKGLTGQALTDALNSVISKAMDEIAVAALPGLDSFRKVGEGYAETVMRVASGVESAKLELELLGITAVKFTEITNKQGDVGAEIVRQSIVLTEQYHGALTGVGEIMSAMPGTASDLAKSYKELLDLRTQMTKVGLGEDVNVSVIKGAGGTSQLSSALSAYFDNFFTQEERLKAETNSLAKEFEALNLTVPTSRAEFRGWVESARLAGTEAGDRLTGKLLTLAEAFNTLTASTEETVSSQAKLKEINAGYQKTLDDMIFAGLPLAEQRKIETAGMAESTLAIKNRIYALTDEAAAVQKAKQAHDAYIAALKEKAETSLKILQNSVALSQKRAKEDTTEQIAKINDQKKVATTLFEAQKTLLNGGISSAKALGGLLQAEANRIRSYATGMVLADNSGSPVTSLQVAQASLRQGNLSDNNLKAATDLSPDMFASWADYAVNFYETQSLITDFASKAGSAAGEQYSMAAQLTAQLEQAEAKYSQDTAYYANIQRLAEESLSAQNRYFENILQIAADQLAEAQGTKLATMSLTDALTGYSNSVNMLALNLNNKVSSSLPYVPPAFNVSSSGASSSNSGVEKLLVEVRDELKAMLKSGVASKVATERVAELLDQVTGGGNAMMTEGIT